MATAAEIQVAYKAIYRTDLNATVAAAIANSGISVDAYVAQQLPQVAATTQAAVAIASFVTGTAPTSDKLDALKVAADAQVASYTALGSSNPQLGAFEAFGRSFATDSTTTAGFNTKYGALSTSDFIAVVYAQVYGTQPTAAAAANLTAQINYFTNLYTVNGVANASLAAKGAVLGQIVGYAFTSSASANSNLDNQVASLLTSAAKGDATVYNKALPAVVDPGTVGVTLTAASGTEISPTAADPALKSTANNDTVNFALTNVVATDAATKINAGAGEDTLNLTNVGSAYAPTAGIVQGIEKVTVTTSAASSIDFTNISGVKQVTLNTGSVVGAVAFNNLALDATVVVKANTLATPLTIDYTGATATTGSVTLDGVSKGSVIFTDATVKTVNITTVGTANELKIADADVESVKVSGTGSFVSTGNTLTALKSFDASGVATFSNVNFTGTASTNAATFTLGAGSDRIEVDTNKAHTINVGTGNDTVELNIADGAANNLTADAISTAAKLAAAVVTVNGLTFSGATGDLIRFDNGVAADSRTVLTQTQIDQAAAAGDILQAVEFINDLTATGDLAFFKFGTDTYAYYDNTAGTAIGANDALVKLTGVDFATLSFTGATQNVTLA